MGDSCVLQWGAPDDNGGADITNYIVERKPSGTTQYVKYDKENMINDMIKVFIGRSVIIHIPSKSKFVESLY